MARKVSFKVFGYNELTDAAKDVAVASLEANSVTEFKAVLEAEYTADGKWFDPAVLDNAAVSITIAPAAVSINKAAA